MGVLNPGEREGEKNDMIKPSYRKLNLEFTEMSSVLGLLLCVCVCVCVESATTTGKMLKQQSKSYGNSQR